ncbi:unnamed protein product [Rhizophagus irregularis]|nr:unnamed protein product [Rhizophagus irregularis]
MNNSATQKNINKEDWLLWQFADSALPTGGFVASSGLEVAVQSGYVKDNNSLLIFLSSTQGVAMLTLFSKSFGEEFSKDNEGKRNISDRIIDKFKFEVRKESTFGHLPVAFGIERAQHLFLFLFSRAALSAAVRLNIVGPYYAQRILTECHSYVESSLEKLVILKLMMLYKLLLFLTFYKVDR